MFKTLVSKIALLTGLSVIAIGISLSFLSLRESNRLVQSMTVTTDRILDQDVQNKIISDERSSETYGKAIIDYMTRIALPPLWDLNYEILKDYADSMIQVPDVVSVAIYDENGSVVAGKPLSKEQLESPMDLKTFFSEIVKDGVKIGTISIWVSRNRMNDLKEGNERTKKLLMKSFQQGSDEAQALATSRMLIMSLVAMAITMTISSLLVFYLINPIRKITAGVERLGKRQVIEPSSSYDNGLRHRLSTMREDLSKLESSSKGQEATILSSALISMASTIESHLIVQRAVSKIMNVAAISKAKDDFVWNFVRLVMKETPSCMSGFYVARESDPKTMDLIASVGLPPGTSKSIKTEDMEGLFGASIMDGKVRMVEVPPGRYLPFATLAGNLAPIQFITVPLKDQDGIIAMFSMASLTAYPENYPHIFSLVQEGMNAALANLIAGERERELIQELQGANEELAAQSEELEYQAAELEIQNQELEVQKRRSEQASRLKTEFLSNMSHELRTPLNSILALSKILRSNEHGGFDDEEVEYLEIIERNGKNLLGLINGILDLARIEAGREDVDLKKVRVETILTNVTDSLRPIALDKGISLEISLPEEPQTILTDEDKLSRIMTNIVSNAVKFTEEGGVSVRAVLEGPFTSITVEDTGIGIPQKDLKLIFDEFRQGDGSTVRKFEGTGLGLSIAQKYANMLGISISVKSQEGKGSVFTVKIPNRPDLNLDRTTSPQDDITVYIVEDNILSSNNVRRILVNNEIRTVAFSRAKEALDAIVITPPDGIVLDLVLPDMNGFEFIKELRFRTHGIPVMILTAKALTSEDKRFLRDHEVDYVLDKEDIESKTLISKIRKMIKNGRYSYEKAIK